MNRKVVSAVVVAVLAAAGVIYGVWRHNNTTPKSVSTAATTNQSSSTQNVAETNSITIKDFAFSPATVKVKKGTKITWTNQDNTAHTVTATNGGGFDSGSIANGGTFSFTFNQTGTFTYKCNFHPDMFGTVIVQ